MSTVHGSAFWCPQAVEAKTYQAIDKQSVVRGWQISTPTKFTQKVHLFGMIVDKVIETAAAIAKKQIRSVPSEKQGLPFSVNPNKTLTEQLQLLRDGPIYKIMKPLVDEMSALASRYIEEQYGMGALAAFGLEEGVMTSNRFIFNYSMTNSNVNQWVKELSIDSMAFVYRTLKVNSLGYCLFNPEAIVFLGGSKAIEKLDPKQTSCTNYALLRKQELHAKQAILSGGDGKVALRDLKEMGYRSVLHPDSGDLVLYMNESGIDIQHVGLYTENGLVESKWGINNSEVFLHQVFEVPPNYGTKVVFMRKSSAII